MKDTNESDKSKEQMKRRYLIMIIIFILTSIISLILVNVRIMKSYSDIPMLSICFLIFSILLIVGGSIFLYFQYRKAANSDALAEERRASGKYSRPTVVESNLWTSYAASGFAGGDGSKDNPYQIAKPEQLAYLAKEKSLADRDYHYVITNDLDMIEHYWVSIGQNTPGFLGTIDGNGKTILHLLSCPDGDSNHGLIFHTPKCTIQNLTLKKCVFAAHTGRVGGFIGDAESAEVTLENCRVNSCILLTMDCYAFSFIGYYGNAKLSGKHTSAKSNVFYGFVPGFEGCAPDKSSKYSYTESASGYSNSPHKHIDKIYKKQEKMAADWQKKHNI